MSGFAKRALDLSVSVIGLLLLSPILAVVAALIRIKLGTPVLFRHTRPGLNGAPFDMVSSDRCVMPWMAKDVRLPMPSASLISSGH